MISTLDHHRPRLVRASALAVLAAILAVVAVTLSQCRQVSGTLTGTDFTVLNPALNARSDCVHQCNDRFRSAHSAEVRRHEAALNSCGDDSDCIRAENRMHHDRQLATVRDMQSCKRSCRSTGPKAAGD